MERCLDSEVTGFIGNLISDNQAGFRLIIPALDNLIYPRVAAFTSEIISRIEEQELFEVNIENHPVQRTAVLITPYEFCVPNKPTFSKRYMDMAEGTFQLVDRQKRETDWVKEVTVL